MYADPLHLARALIQKQSVTPTDAGAIGTLAEALSAMGFACTRMSFGADAGRPQVENLYARLGTSGPNFCFAGHTDVVPVGQGWTVPPFAAEVNDETLWGRGAADMKGAIAAFVAAVARAQADNALKGSVSLLITGDEEGSALDGTRRVLETLKAKGEKLDACLVGEPTSVAELGDTAKIGRRGSLTARLTVFGAQGHSAYPQLADNPIPRLLAALNALTREPLDTGTANFEPSILVPTTIDVGNAAPNVIPAEARAGFNVRFNDLHTGRALGDRFRKQIAAVAGRHELAIEISGESFLTKPGPLTEAVSAAVEAETGKRPALTTGGGTSDARFIKDHCPVVELGLVGRTMHKADERVPLADLESLTRIYRRTIAALAGK